MGQVLSHPCFNCILPDCDDKSALCNLRRSYNEYQRLTYKGLPVTEEQHRNYRAAWKELISPNSERKAKGAA